jgi:hypothetical protein
MKFILLIVCLWTRSILAQESINAPASIEIPQIPSANDKEVEAKAIEPQITEQNFAMDPDKAKLMQGRYEYLSRSKPDPFMPAFKRFSPLFAVKKSKEIRIISPLQTELSDLSIRGIWQNEDKTWRALVVTKDGQGVVAKANDPIGPLGKVAGIDETGIQVRQFSFKDDGTREYEDTIMPFMRMEQSKGMPTPMVKPEGVKK